MPKFDWAPRHDPRSFAFAASDVVGREVPFKYWAQGPVLDQGTEGACVGHGVAGALTASPLRSSLRDPQAAAFGIYRAAQHYDEWAGNDYDGTSVLAGLTIAKMIGEISEYRWCFGLPDVLDALSLGPVVIGVEWTEGMLTPDHEGRIHATGATVGGHCVVVTGFTRAFRRVRIRQSWGIAHGIAGTVWLGFDDLEQLLSRRGEAALPIA